MPDDAATIIDIFDHARPQYGTGAKIGIDASRNIPGEGLVRAWPDELHMSDEMKSLVERQWKKCDPQAARTEPATSRFLRNRISLIG